MAVDGQFILNSLIMTAVAAVGWFARQIWDAVQELKQDVHEIEVDLPKNYVRQDQIESRLDKIDSRFDKLDSHIARLFEKMEKHESSRRS